MNVLCVAPYHVTGTLSLWKREFARRGIRFRYVTLFRSPFGFEEDICLDLPLQPSSDAFVTARDTFYRIVGRGAPDDAPIPAKPPFQPPPHPLAQAFFAARDTALAPRIESAIRALNLDDADLVWLDQGAEFFRDGRWAADRAAAGVPLMAFYHGSDMRNRGILPQVDKHLSLRLTSEVDLLFLDDRLEYLFLPIDTAALAPAVTSSPVQHGTPVTEQPLAGVRSLPDDPATTSSADTGVRNSDESSDESSGQRPLRVGHAARVRANKGSDTIIAVVEGLRTKGYPVEMEMIEGVPHAEALRRKAACDVFVDQIADAGGWGYGMSGVESLAMGLPTLTRMSDAMTTFLPDHPFVDVTADTLESELIRLIEDNAYRAAKAAEGLSWVRRTHDIRAVADRLLAYWDREGWLRTNA